MLRRGVVVRWVPRYARQFPRGRGRGRKAAAAAAGLASVASNCSTESPVVRAYDEQVALAAKARQREVKKGAPSTPDSTIPDVSNLLLRKAEKLLDRWQKLSETMVTRRIGGVPSVACVSSPNKIQRSSLDQERDAVLFMAQTEVFAVVKGVLPSSTRQDVIVDRSAEDKGPTDPQKGSTQEGRSTRGTSSMVIIPDEAAADAVKYLEQLGKRHAGTVQGGVDSVEGPSPTSALVFSLHELVVFLQLYNDVNCEDGELLLRLLAELRRVVFSARKGLDNEPGVLSIREESVVPRLLLTLSSLGIVEDNVLQRLVTVNGGRFISRAKIARYSEADLVRLLVAFHRFGLHHEPCFGLAAKVLRRKSLCSPLSSFRRRALSYKTDSLPAGDVKSGGVPALMSGLTLNELLEALTAVSLSLSREREVVELLAATIVAAVEEEEGAVHRNGGGARTREEDAGFFRTLQVHRAAKVCEQMEQAQPALAHLLHRLSIRYGGVLADGGEEALSPERVGFYDFVTADLVKVRRS
ncbi:uncharacterized protein Tco025E_00854 [Trypanosoma conorhini]|uniref:Uncharacterized protein n=1 Tax=Trypanosoma conorhini TaxID=83891 RepID=A0A3R7N7W1_9TRYP|nr:uncharacterized protein Tco025E_00854 [Trypanosoma conorhini]RNF26891.1 hypothetical protein Tco025E_00854 [Trypanosoma conorhini]